MKPIIAFSIVVVALFAIVIAGPGQTNKAAQAQANDCGNGLTWQFEVGDVGWINLEPPLVALRVRESPGGPQVGSIEPGKAYVVVGGPTCDADGLTWWQVISGYGSTAEEDTYVAGWIAEGADGEYFTEPLARRVMATDPNAECTGESAFRPGQRVRIKPDTPYFFGHPAIVDVFFTIPDEVLTVSSDPEPILFEGPICFGGERYWSTDNHPDLTYELDVNAAIGRQGWINENDIIGLADEQVEPGLAFEPTTFVLLPDPPLVDVERQIAYFPGFGGGGGYNYNSTAIFWESNTCELSQYAYTGKSACISLYPFEIGETVEVAFYDPSGAEFDVITLQSEPLLVTQSVGNSNDIILTRTIAEVGAVHVTIPVGLGYAPGMWRVEARTGDTTRQRAYQYERSADPPLKQACEGARPALALFGYEPGSTHELVLIEELAAGIDPATGNFVGNYRELRRWSLSIGPHGELLVFPGYVLPTGELLLVEPGGTWMGPVPNTDYTILSSPRVRSFWPCVWSSPTPVSISYGDLVTGGHEIVDEDSAEVNHVYTFSGAADDPVRIALVSSDPEDRFALQLQSPAGVKLLEESSAADTEQNSPNGMVVELVLPEDGAYSISVTLIELAERPPIQGRGLFLSYPITGYTLTLQSDTAGAPILAGADEATAPASAADLAYGDFIEGDVTSAEGETLTFNASAGDVVTIVLDSDEFDTYLELVDPAGALMAEDDDGGNGTSSLLENVELPEAGTYSIVVRGVGGKGGAYSLSLKQVSGAAPDAGASAPQPTATPVPAATHTPAPTATTRSATATLPPDVCPGLLPPRLRPGGKGTVIDSAPNNIRTQAGGSDIIGQIPPGGVFDVLEGPLCWSNAANVWWRVNYNGIVGWTAESGGSKYWLAPVE